MATDLPTGSVAATGFVADAVKEYYGTVLSSSQDLKTSACCTAEAPPPHIAAALTRVHEEVKDRFYGCGSPIPAALDGITVLDVGCGSGRDAYVLSQLVGPKGRVIGVDMTEEQLAVARRHQDWHAERFGWANTEFHQGYIEDLAAAGIADDSVDLVVSNCVLNLSPDKPRVFREIFRVLKPGGELYFSDVFTSRTVRAFSVPLEDRCEDYGQVATYRGTLSEHPHGFNLDDHHSFRTGKPMLVCGNTADMLSLTRYVPHFTVTGDKSTHFGLFPCAPADAVATSGTGTASACC